MCNISETDLSECFTHSTFGTYFATAGQRIDPNRESTFVWKETFTNMHIQKISLMSYTKWYQGKPNYDNAHGGYEACMNFFSLRGQVSDWNDYYCGHPICSVCEIDM